MTSTRKQRKRKKPANFVDVVLMSRLLVLVSLCLVVASCTTQAQAVFHADDDITVYLEVAEEREDLLQGLMYRDHLDEDTGMLFIFQDEQPRVFWMKNTLIPLDMIFINAAQEVVAIVEQAQPCEGDPCDRYPSNAPATYVIEVNGGFARSHNIQVGQQVDLPV